ncbi:BON domain-containing protein [Hyalangium minutum]|uniref:BON domain-containing protein n=1 Tax=Hyalangium minutum TaxID=394096 RepID=A0A085WP54_9BACT|nr:BON domain-containing protein [Hyalangium minutum]KFE69467.1 hypothetical protein DB31_6442 [Hyalangium minutum]
MAGRRDDEKRFRGDVRDAEADRRTDRHRGSDERGYGEGERLGRDWERADMRGTERARSTRDELTRSADEKRFGRGREDFGSRELPREQGERRFRDPGRERDVRRYDDRDREMWGRAPGDVDREDWRASPSGSFHDELREERGRPQRYGERMGPSSRPYDTERWRGEAPEREERPHYNLAGLHDLDDLSELRHRYSEQRHHRDYEPRYGHGPGVENMEPLRTGYGTSMTRRENGDRELGHGGMLGGTYRESATRPMGRGPKGYQRSDSRIREELCDRLMMSWMDAENVDVQVKDGEIILLGTVKSRDEKRAIEALAESVLGVKDVHNSLRVQREGQVSTSAQPEVHGEQLPLAQNREGQAQVPGRRGPAPERGAQDQEQAPVQKPGDTPLHS